MNSIFDHRLISELYGFNLMLQILARRRDKIHAMENKMKKKLPRTRPVPGVGIQFFFSFFDIQYSILREHESILMSPFRPTITIRTSQNLNRI